MAVALKLLSHGVLDATGSLQPHTPIMAFGLAIGTERAMALQVGARSHIGQRNHLKRFYREQSKMSWANGATAMNLVSPTNVSRSSRCLYVCTDFELAEYMTIMIINNKTPGAFAE